MWLTSTTIGPISPVSRAELGFNARPNSQGSLRKVERNTKPRHRHRQHRHQASHFSPSVFAPYTTFKMVMDHTRDPCPWVILNDFGGAFAMGVGSIIPSSTTRANNFPRLSEVLYGTVSKA